MVSVVSFQSHSDVVIFGSLVAAPFLCFWTYVRATDYADWIRNDVREADDRRNLSQGLDRRDRWRVAAVFAWLLAFLASWRTGSNLNDACGVRDPPRRHHPAATSPRPRQQGHACLVGRIENAPFNLQLRRLKFLECAFRALWPRGHRRLRHVYDRLGPPLASLCRLSPWFADVTFLLFKPLEVVAECVRISLRVPRSNVEQLWKQ